MRRAMMRRDDASAMGRIEIGRAPRLASRAIRPHRVWRASRRKDGGGRRRRACAQSAACSSSNALATISARPGVVGKPASSAGRSQRASRELLVQDRLAGEPARRKRQDDEVALDPVVAVARDRLADSPRARPARSSRLVSSRTSRTTACIRVSPISTTPPGRLNRPSAGARARRTTSTCPSRTMAALTARNGRSG